MIVLYKSTNTASKGGQYASLLPHRLYQINIENNLVRIGKLIVIHTHGRYYRHVLGQLLNNLKLLKRCHEKGVSREFLDKFYAFYEFN